MKNQYQYQYHRKVTKVQRTCYLLCLEASMVVTKTSNRPNTKVGKKTLVARLVLERKILRRSTSSGPRGSDVFERHSKYKHYKLSRKRTRKNNQKKSRNFQWIKNQRQHLHLATISKIKTSTSDWPRWVPWKQSAYSRTSKREANRLKKHWNDYRYIPKTPQLYDSVSETYGLSKASSYIDLTSKYCTKS